MSMVADAQEAVIAQARKVDEVLGNLPVALAPGSFPALVELRVLREALATLDEELLMVCPACNGAGGEYTDFMPCRTCHSSGVKGHDR